VPWSDQSVLVGATVEHAGFNEHSTAAGVRSLTSAVADLFTEGRTASVDDIRVGLRPVLPDELPAIGPFARAPRVTVATAHYRNGVLLSPLTADIVSRFVLTGEKDAVFEQTSPDRPLAWPAGADA
jgi:glycine/D-amino acid oxidase-like deaminating enzyme